MLPEHYNAVMFGLVWFLHKKNTTNTSGTVATDGFYEVDDNFAYTYVINNNRIGNPNGIDFNSLTLGDITFGASHNNYVINYDFSSMYHGLGLEITGDFFIVYAPMVC